MTTKTDTLQVPTIHLNGSDSADLVDKLRAARLAIAEASQALRMTAPHARDYYAQNDTQAFQKARQQYTDRTMRLASVADELTRIAVGIQRQPR